MPNHKRWAYLLEEVSHAVTLCHKGSCLQVACRMDQACHRPLRLIVSAFCAHHCCEVRCVSCHWHPCAGVLPAGGQGEGCKAACQCSDGPGAERGHHALTGHCRGCLQLVLVQQQPALPWVSPPHSEQHARAPSCHPVHNLRAIAPLLAASHAKLGARCRRFSCQGAHELAAKGLKENAQPGHCGQPLVRQQGLQSSALELVARQSGCCLQVGFFTIVGLPMFRCFVDVFEDAAPLLDGVLANFRMWERAVQEGK